MCELSWRGGCGVAGHWEQVGQQIFNDMYRDAVKATEAGDLREAMEKYLQCIQVLTPPDGVITATNGGNGLHVHLYNQLAKVMLADGMLEGAEEYSERAADLGMALLKKRQDLLKQKPQLLDEEEEEDKASDAAGAAAKEKFNERVRDDTERDEVRAVCISLVASGCVSNLKRSGYFGGHFPAAGGRDTLRWVDGPSIRPSSSTVSRRNSRYCQLPRGRVSGRRRLHGVEKLIYDLEPSDG